MASFGDTLRRERELRGVDLREVAEATRISVRFLQALENDRIDVLPGGIFPRAFVRQYATYLGLDPDRTVAEFVYASGEQAGQPTTPAPARSLRMPSLAAAVLLAIAGLGAWAALRDDAQGPAEPVAAAQAPTSTFAPDPVYPPPTTAASLPDAQGALVLTLSSRQSCWVAVLADGVKVMDRVMNEGEAQTITAKGEMVLSVGNAGGITFTLNGRPGVSLGREGEVRRNIVITRQSVPSLVQQAVPAASPHAG
ncbi:MAG TPA: helix-turn-helix domain-containing protein [Vicinamibacteria bacterium]|nr:helix-turn-helix domain-containing protein [Vicinamibacteria bacterium]